MHKIYYAHPINIYGSKQELRDMETIRKLFQSTLIYNPSTDSNAEEGYKELRMKYFENIVKECSMLVFRSFVDGKIPSGVMFEIDMAKKIGIPIIELPNYYNRRLNVDDTRQYLVDIGCR